MNKLENKQRFPSLVRFFFRIYSSSELQNCRVYMVEMERKK